MLAKADKIHKTSERYRSSRIAAADVKAEHIIDYLCDCGPSLCHRCPSQCAYGKRYLEENPPWREKD